MTTEENKTSTLPASFRRRGQEVSKTGSLPRNAGSSNFERGTGAAEANNSLGQKIRKSCRNWAVQKGLINRGAKSAGNGEVQKEEPKENTLAPDDAIPQEASNKEEGQKEMDIGAIVASLVVEAHKKKMASRAASRAQSREALLDTVNNNEDCQDVTKEVVGEESGHRSQDVVTTTTTEESTAAIRQTEHKPDIDAKDDNLIENSEQTQNMDIEGRDEVVEEIRKDQQNAEQGDNNEEEEVCDKNVDEANLEIANDADKTFESFNTSSDQISNESNSHTKQSIDTTEAVTEVVDDDEQTSDPEPSTNNEKIEEVECNVPSCMEIVAEEIVDEIVDTVTSESEDDLMAADKSKQVVIDNDEMASVDKLER